MSRNRSFPRSFKILLIGNVKVGKTSLVRRFVEGSFDEHTAVTLGFDVRSKQLMVESADKQQVQVNLKVWDTAGQERFKTVTSSYYRNASAVALCFDVSSQSSFKDLELWMKDVRTWAPDGVMLFVIGNKADLPPEEWQVNLEYVQEWANHWDMLFFLVSAKENYNVEQAFMGISSSLLQAFSHSANGKIPLLRMDSFASSSTEGQRINLSDADAASPLYSGCCFGGGVAASVSKEMNHPLDDAQSRASLTGGGGKLFDEQARNQDSDNLLTMVQEQDAQEVHHTEEMQLEGWPAEGLASMLRHSANEQKKSSILGRNRLPSIDTDSNFGQSAIVMGVFSGLPKTTPDRDGMVTCKHGCGARYKFYEHVKHYETCTQRPVLCRLGCGVFMKASEQEAHEKSYDLIPATKWSCTEVLHWMVGVIGRNNWNVGAITEHGIDGQCLLKLTQEDLLLELDIKSVIRRNKVAKGIEQLNAQLAAQRELVADEHVYQSFHPQNPSETQHVSSPKISPGNRNPSFASFTSDGSAFDTWDLFKQSPSDSDTAKEAANMVVKRVGQDDETDQELMKELERINKGDDSSKGSPNQSSEDNNNPFEAKVKLQDGRFVWVKVIKFTEIDLEPSSVVGSGSFGTVFMGNYHGATVAVKRLHAQQFDAPELLREAAVMQSVSAHPNILHFYGVILTPPNAGFVSEALKCSLEEWLRRDKGNHEEPLSEVIRFALEAASGLMHLHCENVVHRDVAARNLLMDSSHPRKVKLCDFGMARVAEKIGYGPDAEIGGGSLSLVGPIRWMAPESLHPEKGHTKYSFKTDVYMFGITLWELLSRDIPYNGVPTQEVGVRVVMDELRPPNVSLRPTVKRSIKLLLETHSQQYGRTSKPSVAHSLVSLMEECWAADPRDRPTMVQVHASLMDMKTSV